MGQRKGEWQSVAARASEIDVDVEFTEVLAKDELLDVTIVIAYDDDQPYVRTVTIDQGITVPRFNALPWLDMRRTAMREAGAAWEPDIALTGPQLDEVIRVLSDYKPESQEAMTAALRVKKWATVIGEPVDSTLGEFMGKSRQTASNYLARIEVKHKGGETILRLRGRDES